jgi:hypothetical protein
MCLELLTDSWSMWPGIIDDEKKIKHSKLAEKTEAVITDPTRINVRPRLSLRVD